MSLCNDKTIIFQEAIDHCRWKKVLYDLIEKINIDDYKGKRFEEIFIEIDEKIKPIRGLGTLTVYDLTSAICRHFEINIDKVYIIGKGPKRAIEILNIKTKKHKINDKIKLNYVDISDVINAFDNNNYVLDEKIRNSKNGDIVETYICNWQKTK